MLCYAYNILDLVGMSVETLFICYPCPLWLVSGPLNHKYQTTLTSNPATSNWNRAISNRNQAVRKSKHTQNKHFVIYIVPAQRSWTCGDTLVSPYPSSNSYTWLSVPGGVYPLWNIRSYQNMVWWKRNILHVPLYIRSRSHRIIHSITWFALYYNHSWTIRMLYLLDTLVTGHC